ncbi:MAG: hypothetical protein H7178_05000 [Chitinophagaceae bacterium]|nr:hypothetical protein [Chitinophagaceae bacterium]
MKKITIALVFAALICLQATAQKIAPADLKMLEGAWVGTLTYLDYKSNKTFTMPANTTFQQSKENPNIYLRSIGYSTEPHANQKDSMIISKDGTMLDDYKIISNKKLKNGSIEIITEKNSVDGNDHKPAVLRHIYFIGKILFINRKEVKFAGTDKWIMRNEYRFTR